jgi:hypothetical protein
MYVGSRTTITEFQLQLSSRKDSHHILCYLYNEKIHVEMAKKATSAETQVRSETAPVTITAAERLVAVVVCRKQRLHHAVHWQTRSAGMMGKWSICHASPLGWCSLFSSKQRVRG